MGSAGRRVGRPWPRRDHEDLPVDDATATFEDYADVVVAAMADAPEDAVLVGHSLAGMILPMVAARRAVGLMVFVCAVVPKLGGMPWDDVGPMGDEDYGAVKEADGRSPRCARGGRRIASAKPRVVDEHGDLHSVVQVESGQ